VPVVDVLRRYLREQRWVPKERVKDAVGHALHDVDGAIDTEREGARRRRGARESVPGTETSVVVAV
jgi:hypothetical protein